MLIKWIVCRVEEAHKAAFSSAQREWKALWNLEGFLGQVGGWDLNAPEDACILSLWKDRPTYETFMRNEHDKVVAASKQSWTYESIGTVLVEPIYKMPGKHTTILDCLEQAAVLRVADCFVTPEREEHFDEAERRIWIPGLAEVPGMLAGSCNKAPGKEVRYVVTTLWSSLEEHQQYTQTLLPSMQKSSDVSHDIKRMYNRVIPLERDWLVSPEHSR